MKVYRVEFCKTVLVLAEDSTAAVALAERNESKAIDGALMAERVFSMLTVDDYEIGTRVLHAGAEDVTIEEALARAAAT